MRRVADRLAALASAPDERPSMSDLVEIQATGDSLPLKSEEGIELAAAAAAASSWSEQLRKLLVRPRSSAGAHAVAVDDSVTALKIIVASIRAAIADLEGSGEPPESEEGQFCLCRQPGGREMLGCDKCGDWYHLRCVQVTANFARTAKHYVCPACCAADGDVFKLNKPDVVYRHIHRTRRPALAAMGELFLEASSFSGVLPEEALLAEVFAAHDEWRAAVAAAAERRAGVAGVESAAKEAKEKWDAAEAAAAVPRDARLARTKAVADRAAPPCSRRRCWRGRRRWRRRFSAPAVEVPRRRRSRRRRGARTCRRSNSWRCWGNRWRRRRRSNSSSSCSSRAR